MIKKTTCFILSLLFVFSLCACGAQNSDGRKASDITPMNENRQEDTNVTYYSEYGSSSVPAEKETQIEVTETENKTENQKVTLGPEMVIKGQQNLTGDGTFAPLESVTYNVTDPNNTRNLSTKKICHSHGPASGGKPHYTVTEFQNTFDKYGALTLDRTSGKKVLYLTFDCGWEYNNLTASILDTLKEKDVPAAFFCTLDHIEKQPELISRMINEGHIVGNHSATHPSFAEIDRTKMAHEIEKTENFLRENYGYCAKYFRFPAGEYNESALDLVSSLGYMSVFWSVAYNDWNVKEIKGKDYAVKTVLERLHDGAVILLHSVSRDNADALPEIIDSARKQGYEFKALTDYKFPN